MITFDNSASLFKNEQVLITGADRRGHVRNRAEVQKQRDWRNSCRKAVQGAGRPK